MNWTLRWKDKSAFESTAFPWCHRSKLHTVITRWWLCPCMKTSTSVEFKDCDWKILDMPERVVFVRQQREYLVLTQKQETFAMENFCFSWFCFPFWRVSLEYQRWVSLCPEEIDRDSMVGIGLQGFLTSPTSDFNATGYKSYNGIVDKLQWQASITVKNMPSLFKNFSYKILQFHKSPVTVTILYGSTKIILPLSCDTHLLQLSL